MSSLLLACNVNPVSSSFSCNFDGSPPGSARARSPQTVEQFGWRKREDLRLQKFSIVVVREGLLGATRLVPRPVDSGSLPVGPAALNLGLRPKLSNP